MIFGGNNNKKTFNAVIIEKSIVNHEKFVQNIIKGKFRKEIAKKNN